MRRSPLLLVLDEPTAALDAQAEHDLFERYAVSARAVAAERGGIAVIVSHRLSAARTADLILVLGDGAIIEQGSHNDLMANGGLYAELFALQSAAYT
jgi:ATP-binding cassette subfamily B protein